MSTLLRAVRRAVNFVLKPLGFALTRLDGNHNWADGRTYIPFHATIAAAAVAGLGISEFVETKHNRRGATDAAFHAMADLGVFEEAITTVCEIGPGSGRYLERTAKICRPAHYEIYETANDWAEWLVKTHHVTLLPTDGKTLASTPARSMDLVHAHKVFVTTPTLTTCSYLAEMARVVKDGGKVVFDVVTEECLDAPTLNLWLAPGSWPSAFPYVMPKQYVIDFLGHRGLVFRGSFLEDMKPGKTECMVFARASAGGSPSPRHEA